MNTDQQQKINVAIAEACGWTKRCDTPEQTWAKGVWTDTKAAPRLKESYGCHLPKYHGSLDAMAQAEATLTDEDEWGDYMTILEHMAISLCRTIADQVKRSKAIDRAWISATAEQRALAFCKVKGIDV